MRVSPLSWVGANLRRKLTWIMASVTVVVTLLVSGLLIDQGLKNVLKRRAQSNVAVMEAIAASAAPWLVARDLVGLQEIANGLVNLPDFESVMILDIQGRVLSHTELSRIGSYVTDLPIQVQAVHDIRSGGWMDLLQPVTLGGEHVGWVRLRIEDASVQVGVHDARLKGMVFVLGGLLVVVMASYLTATTLTRRLYRVRQVADAVRDGDPDVRVRLEGQDEVAGLANDLDGMLDTIQSQSHRLQAVIDGTGVGTWEWNVVTGGVDFNEQWANMFGYTKAELQPLNIGIWYRLTVEEDRQSSQAAFEAHIKGHTPFYEAEYRGRHKEGHVVWIHSRGRAMERTPDGKALRMYGTMSDVTQRKLAEAELRGSRDKLHALFANTPIGIAQLTLDGRYLNANTSLQRMLGRSLPELQVMHFQELTAPECHEPDVLYMADLLRKGINGPYEKRYIRPDGSTVHGRLNSVLVQSAGEESFIWNVIEDVTAQKAMEATLHEARSQAEQASRAKSQFVANMSHEIRTPLNAVLGMLQLLHRTALTERQYDYVEKSEGAAQSLLALLNDILDYSKVEAGKLVLDPDQFQPAQLLDDLSTILAGNLKGRRIEVVFDVDPELPSVLVGDALRLKQILINLCGNAIKFTPHGEVVLHLAVVTGSTQAQPGEIELEFRVRDTGIGIAPEVQEKIFSGFTQAESSTTRKFGGTGLGLYISQRLVQMMGGELRLDSAPGQGSTFLFRLVFPVVDACRVEPKAVHVLVVEPHADSRVAFEKAVQSLGWSATVVADRDGATAAWLHSKASGLRLDAVLVDRAVCAGASDWEGSELCTAILTGPQAPVLLVTGYGDEEAMQSVQTLLDSGGSWVPKPLSALTLRRTFKHAQHRLQQGVTASGQTQGGALTGLSEWAGLPRSGRHTPRLAGLRLLLVEDNLINQQVARELLMAEGAEVEVAENGQLAVDVLSQPDHRFDLVLMDMQMPVMDGLQATHVIRQRLGQSQLPVVAMTANAMTQDKAACAEAGMNDHVGKPFALDELVHTVLRWTRGAAVAELAVATDTTPAPAVPSVPLWVAEASSDGERLDVVGALQRLGGDPAFYVRVLRGFLDTLPDVAAELALQAQGVDLAAMAANLHTLKGSAATAGLQTLSGGAAQTERAVKATLSGSLAEGHATSDDDGMTPSWGTQWEALQAEWPRSVEVAQMALTRLQEHMQAAVPKAVDVPRAEWMEALRHLMALLVASDMDALDRYDALAEIPSFQAESELAAFRNAMESMDFEAALSELQEWLRGQ